MTKKAKAIYGRKLFSRVAWITTDFTGAKERFRGTKTLRFGSLVTVTQPNLVLTNIPILIQF